MTGHRRISQVFLCAVALTGCSTEHGLYDTALTRPSTVSSEPVTISAPQFYKREDLINERRNELYYLRDELRRSETATFGAELSRDIETVTAMSAQLGLSFDAGLKRLVGKAKPLNDLEDEIAAVKLQAQLAQLQRDLQLQQDQLAKQTVPSNATITTSTTAVPGGSATALPDFTTLNALVKSLQERLEQLRTKPTAISAVDSPIDVFQDRQAYRRVLQSAINATSLDDLHDYQGHSLFRMQFKALAKPRKREFDDALAVLRMHIKAPTLSPEELAKLYLEWLDHQTLRMNESIGDKAVPDPTPFALAASALFTIAEFSVDPVGSGDIHDCEGVKANDVSATVGPQVSKASSAEPLATTRPNRNLRSKKTPSKGVEEKRSKPDMGLMMTATPPPATCIVVRLALPYRSSKTSQATNDSGKVNSPFTKGLYLSSNLLQSLEKQTAGIPTAECDASNDSLKDMALQGAGSLLALRDASVTQSLSPEIFARLLKIRSAALNCLNAKDRLDASLRDKIKGIKIPDEFSDALKEEGGTAKGWVSTYAVTPTNLVQHVSTTARASRAVQMAASIAASAPVSGWGGNGAFNFAHAASAKADALERVPLVVGFSENLSKQDGASDTSTVFGWVLGPKVVIQPGQKKALALEHMLTPYDLTADVVMPGWWPYFDLVYESGWPLNLDGSAKLGTTSRSMKIPRRHNRGDLDGITDLILEKFSTRVETANIGSIEPRIISACSKNVTFLVKGTNIWRTEKAFLYGLSTNKVQVLPDMGGVSVTFDMSTLPRRPSGTFVEPLLTLATPVGWASTKILIDGSQYGEKPCGAEQVAADSKDRGAPQITTIFPDFVYACEASPRFTVIGSHVGRDIMKVFLGQMEGNVTFPPISGSPGSTHQPDSPVERDANVIEIGFKGQIGDSGGSSASLPLIIRTTQGTTSKDIAVERGDCGASGASPRGPVGLAWATIPAGRLDICSSNATVLISGRAATTFDAATLTLDKPRAVTVQAQAAKVVAAQRLLELTFVGIPREAKPDGGNSATSAKLQLFRKGVKGPTLSIDTACGSTVASK